MLAPVAAAWAGRACGADHGQRATAAALVIAGTLLGLSPVAIRNYAVGGGLVSDDLAAGPQLLHRQQPHGGRHLSAAALRTGAAEFERLDATEIAERAAERRLNPNEVSRYWMGRALDFIASDPAAWLRLMARKAALFVNRGEMLDTEAQEAHAAWSWPLAVLQPVTHFGILLPLAVLGVRHMGRTAPVLDPVGDGRHLRREHHRVLRVRALPVSPRADCMVFAAAGVTRLPLAWPGRAALAAAAVAAVAANWPMLSSNQMRAITETNLGVALFESGRQPEANRRYRARDRG